MAEGETTTVEVDGADAVAVQASDRPYLLVFDLDRSWRKPLPDEGRLSIGRADGADVRLQDSSVSRRHAEIAITPSGAMLFDLGSYNGIALNGERVKGSAQLRPRDVVTVGRATLVLHAPEEVPQVTEGVDTEPLGGVGVRRIALGTRTALVADPAMIRLYALLERLASTDICVLIGGETGAGKEVVASAIHHGSKRASRPFVALNCAAVPEHLAESELFGHEKGAFSGAVAAKPGLFESAAGGTIFLDEIAELSLPVQAKLLRVVETRRATRVGDVKERPIDMRIVAASHRDLEEEVKAGRFREDLYFRLSAATVWIPPLRDRPRELLLLAEVFLEEICAQSERGRLRLSPPVMEALVQHRWPGNLRELRNVIQYAVAATPGMLIETEHLPEKLLRAISLQRAHSSAPPAAKATRIEDEIKDLERRRMIEALEASGGNQSRAAALIGMPRRTFVAKLRQYGLRRDDEA